MTGLKIALNTILLRMDKTKLKEIDRKLQLLKPFQVVDEWVDNEISVRKNPMSTGFKNFDEVLRSNLRGKLGIFAGYGGTKKSLFALNLACRNSQASMDTTAIYSTMEMNATNLLDRMIDYSMGSQQDGVYSVSAVEYWRRKLDDSNKELIANSIKECLKEFYQDKILINQKSRMKPDDYRALLDKALSHGHNVNTLIVDGLSMMGGDGKEVELYSENSAALKEIANEYNIFVGLIAHLSKGLSLDSRDVRSHIRGSQKILDNCDFVMMFSHILEDLDGVIESDETKGFIRCYDKRGTGKMIDTVYNFNKDRLMLEESFFDPKMFLDEIGGDKKQQKKLSWQ